MGSYASLQRPEICLPESLLTLYPKRGSQAPLYYWRYVYPFQFLLGIIGHGFNIAILLRRGMKNKTNYFLAWMAFADLGFLLCLLPNSIATSETLALKPAFYMYFMILKMHLITLANWFSAASIWIVITVTLERLIVIKFPMKARGLWNNTRLIFTLVSIYLSTLILTFYNHFSYTVRFYRLCNGTQLVAKMRPIENEFVFNTTRDGNNDTSMLAYPYIVTYVHLSSMANSVFVVAIPMIALVSFNTCLILSLRRQNTAMSSLVATTACAIHIGHSALDVQSRERKITIMVVVVVSVFTIANAPSMFIAVIELNIGMDQLRLVAILSNGLVVTGKVLNFFLYCLSSSSFRKQSMDIIRDSMAKLSIVLSQDICQKCMQRDSQLLPIQHQSKPGNSREVLHSRVRGRLQTADSILLGSDSKGLLVPLKGKETSAKTINGVSRNEQLVKKRSLQTNLNINPNRKEIKYSPINCEQEIFV